MLSSPPKVKALHPGPKVCAPSMLNILSAQVGFTDMKLRGWESVGRELSESY